MNTESGNTELYLEEAEKSKRDRKLKLRKKRQRRDPDTTTTESESDVMDTQVPNQETEMDEDATSEEEYLEDLVSQRKQYLLNKNKTNQNQQKPIKNNHERNVNKTGITNNTQKNIKPATEKTLTQQIKPNYKPIFVKTNNIRELVKFINENCNSSTIKINAEYASIKYKTFEDAAKIGTYLGNNKIPHFTFTPDSAKLGKTVIKHLPLDYTNEEITESLQKQGIQVVSTSRLHQHRQTTTTDGQTKTVKTQTTMIIVTTYKNQLEHMYTINNVCGLFVKIEPFRPPKNSVPQCHRCLRFGHGSGMCQMPFRCLKCGEEHHQVDCAKAPTDLPTCVHCKGEHAANYKGCLAYKAEVQKKNAWLKNINKPEPKDIAQNKVAPDITNTLNFPKLPSVKTTTPTVKATQTKATEHNKQTKITQAPTQHNTGAIPKMRQNNSTQKTAPKENKEITT